MDLLMEETPLTQYVTDEDIQKCKDIDSSLPEEKQYTLYYEIRDEITIRYIKGCNNDANIILQDIYNTIDSIDQEDFEHYIDLQKQKYALLSQLSEKNKNIIKSDIENARELTVKNFDTFFIRTLEKIYDLLRALALWDSDLIAAQDKIPLDILAGSDNTNKIEDWRTIDDIIKNYAIDKYNTLYPGNNDIPIKGKAIQAHQARIHYRAISEVEYPLDKPNRELWRVIQASEEGQLSFVFETGRSNSEATVICSIDWEDPNTQITKNLTEWDKRVYVSAASLFSGGNDTVTLSQIYKIMGNDGSPNKTQTKKINESLTKMGAARLRINNHGEIEAGYNYPAFEYDAPLLPFERMTATIKGKEITAIHILREPPLISFARGRKQITTIDLELLKSPISKTDDNLRIDDFLLDYISHIKRDKKLSNKLTFDTLCKACNAKTKMQKNRLPEKVEKYLAHYVKCNWIKSYSITEDKDIIIEVEK